MSAKQITLSLAASVLFAGAAEAGTVVLFDNMNRAAGPVTYNCCQSYGVEGPMNGSPGWSGIYVKVAVAFTPQANVSLTEIDAPVSYWSGVNGTTIGLYADDNDKPGRMMRTWTFHNLPPFNTCCSFLAATWPSGIPVVAGRQYWVVVQTNDTMLNTTTFWNLNSTDTTQQHIERWCGDSQQPGGYTCAPGLVSGAWNLELGVPAPALAIIGKN